MKKDNAKFHADSIAVIKMDMASARRREGSAFCVGAPGGFAQVSMMRTVSCARVRCVGTVASVEIHAWRVLVLYTHY